MQSNWWSSLILPIISAVIASGIFQAFFKARSDKELERYKKSYGLLAERQADVIEKIYQNLVDAHFALLQATSPARFGGEPADEELFVALSKARWEGFSFFKQKRLFLSEELSVKINHFYEKVSASELQMKLGCDRTRKDWDSLNKIFDDAEGPLAALLREIEDRFRDLLSGSGS